MMDARGQLKDSVNSDSTQYIAADTNSIAEIARRFAEKEISESMVEFRQDLAASFPTPVVLVKEFAGSSIDFMVYFWATDIR